jgi:hypothetical protein
VGFWIAAGFFRRKEAVMRRAPQWLLPVSSVLLLMLAACGASTLRRSQIDISDLGSVRSEYLTRNPDSPFNDNVTRGEIVRGMDTFAVTASWGLPASKVQDGSDFQRWLYVDVDDVVNESVGYALEFEKGVLKSWNVQRPGIGLKTRDTVDPLGPPKQATPQKGKSLPTD